MPPRLKIEPLNDGALPPFEEPVAKGLLPLLPPDEKLKPVLGTAGLNEDEATPLAFAPPPNTGNDPLPKMLFDWGCD